MWYKLTGVLRNKTAAAVNFLWAAKLTIILVLLSSDL